MQKLIIANWKMHPRTTKEAVAIARASDAANVVVCPPFPFLPAVSRVLKRAAVGSQNAAPGVVGPRTGEVSVGELKELGVRYTILGHSERRAEGEQDAQIAAKVAAALAGGLVPILCIGEPWSVRRKGIAAARAWVQKQLTLDLAEAKRQKLALKNLLIAYEPVWAISTSVDHRDETPEDAAAMAKLIKKILTQNFKFRGVVLYGGSVSGKNAASFLARKEFAGTLVGGASVRPAEFRRVLAAVRTR